MLNINCSKCGQGLKNVFYYKGQPYGCDCFKSVTGMDVESFRRVEETKQEQIKVNDFIEENPVLYVILDEDYEININELKNLGFQKRLGYWIGFIKVDYNTVSFLTTECFKGFTGELNNIYSIDTKILITIEDAKSKVIVDKEKEKENNKKVKEVVKTDNLTIQVVLKDDEIEYYIETSKGDKFKAYEYGDYEDIKGIKGIKKYKEEFENAIDTYEMICKYKLN